MTNKETILAFIDRINAHDLEGLGALIWNARNYSRTEWVFGGIIVLGIVGFLFDRLLRFGARKFLKRYDVTV